MSKTFSNCALGALAASLLGASAGALAHHSYSMFDMKETKTLTGTVKQFDWTNPHTWLWVYVTNDKGSVEQWGIEGMSPNFLGRRGWNRNTLKAGDKITLDIHPLKNGEKGGTFLGVTLPDGKVMKMSGEALRAEAAKAEGDKAPPKAPY
jgi:hypothetical protein